MTPPPDLNAAPTAPSDHEEGPPGSTHPFHVEVDPDLADLIPQYLENKRKDLEKMRAHLDRSEFEPVRILAHSLAGSGGGYGFAGITRIGRAVEKAASAKDAEGARQGLRELENYLNRVIVDVPEA